MSGEKRLLLAEDSDRDAELTLEAIREHGLSCEVHRVRDGAEALDYLYRRGEFANRPNILPHLLLLDLKMPRADGLQVLKQVKSDPRFRRLPVVMMSSSREDRDLAASYDLGVNSFVVKPITFNEFVEAIKGIGLYWMQVNESPTMASGLEPSE